MIGCFPGAQFRQSATGVLPDLLPQQNRADTPSRDKTTTDEVRSNTSGDTFLKNLLKSKTHRKHERDNSLAMSVANFCEIVKLRSQPQGTQNSFERYRKKISKLKSRVLLECNFRYLCKSPKSLCADYIRAVLLIVHTCLCVTKQEHMNKKKRLIGHDTVSSCDILGVLLSLSHSNYL